MKKSKLIKAIDQIDKLVLRYADYVPPVLPKRVVRIKVLHAGQLLFETTIVDSEYETSTPAFGCPAGIENTAMRLQITFHDHDG